MTPKVAVCTPCTDQVAAMFCHDYARMMGHTIRQRPAIQLASWFLPGSLISKQRENLVLEVLTTDYTHILWLDSDMRFPNDTILRLLDRQKRIVVGNYVERRTPYRPVAFPNLETSYIRLFTEPDDTGLVSIEAIGAGVMLVETDVYKKLPEPWYAVGWCEGTKEFVGEDVYFCRKATEAGEKIWLDHDLSKEIKHIGTHEFSMAEAYQAREAGFMEVPA